MAPLPNLDKMGANGPARSNSYNTIRFKTDNYTIRAAQGFNTAEVKYQVNWSCLNQAEADSLADFFDATNGVDLIQWTPPLENEELEFTVETYNVTLADASGADFSYNVTATLIREYDN